MEGLLFTTKGESKRAAVHLMEGSADNAVCSSERTAVAQTKVYARARLTSGFRATEPQWRGALPAQHSDSGDKVAQK